MKAYSFKYQHNIGFGCRSVSAMSAKEAYKNLMRQLKSDGFRVRQVWYMGRV